MAQEIALDGIETSRLDAANKMIDKLVDAGPEDARTILPRKQAATVILRDVVGLSRQETADALGISVYTVDDHSRRARDNVKGTAATTRTLIALELIDPEEDLALDASIVSTEADEQEPADVDERDLLLLGGEVVPAETSGLDDDVVDDVATEVRRALDLNSIADGERLGTLRLDGNRWDLDLIEQEDDVPEPRRVRVGLDSAITRRDVEETDEEDETPTLWGRIMALDAVREVTRSDSSVSVKTRDATDADLATIASALKSDGWDVFDRTRFGSSGVETLRARREDAETRTKPFDEFETDESADEDAQEDAEQETTETPDDDADDESGDEAAHESVETIEGIGPAKGEALRDLGIETVEDLALSDVRRVTGGALGQKVAVRAWRAAQDRLGIREDVDERGLDAVAAERRESDEEGAEQETTEDSADDADDESDEEGGSYTCDDCGRSFDSAGGLGGHRRYCDERDD